MIRGIAYGVGVGPGDPELMTLKAVRLIRENRFIAVPGKYAEESTAYKIAVQAVPELREKELIPVDLPMVKDRELLRKSHQAGARLLETCLDRGENVVFLTLGDSTVYCTFSYLQKILEEDGYRVELVNGIPSFCAAAARLKVPLGAWDEPIHIVPAVHMQESFPDQPGTYVLMKSASRMREVKERLRMGGWDVLAAENCTMPEERLYFGVDEIPDAAGYFSLIIAREQEKA